MSVSNLFTKDFKQYQKIDVNEIDCNILTADEADVLNLTVAENMNLEAITLDVSDSNKYLVLDDTNTVRYNDPTDTPLAIFDELHVDNIYEKTLNNNINIRNDLSMLENDIINPNKIRENSNNNFIDLNDTNNIELGTSNITRLSISDTGVLFSGPIKADLIENATNPVNMLIKSNNGDLNLTAQQNTDSIYLNIAGSPEVEIALADTTINNILKVNVLDEKSGTYITVNGVELRESEIRLDNKVLIENGLSVADQVRFQFDNQDALCYDQLTNRLFLDIAGAPNPEFQIASNGAFEVSNGFDTIVSEPLKIGENNATDVTLLVPLKVDEIKDLDRLSGKLINNYIDLDYELKIDGLYSSSASPRLSLYDASLNNHPNLQLYNDGLNDQSILMDCYHDGTNFISSNASTNYAIQKNNNLLNFNYDSGVTVGNNITFNQGVYMDSLGDLYDKLGNKYYAPISSSNLLTISNAYFNIQESITVLAEVLNNVVTLTIPAKIATMSGTITNRFITSALPSALWPAQATSVSCFITDNNISQDVVGQLFIDTNGTLKIYRTYSHGTNFTVSTIGGWTLLTMTYSLI